MLSTKEAVWSLLNKNLIIDFPYYLPLKPFKIVRKKRKIEYKEIKESF